MRERLFRGKRTDNGEWVYGFYFCMHHNDERKHIHHFIIPIDIEIPKDKTIGEIQVEVIPETVGQYTGLTDKNSKKIVEGDIVKYDNMMFEVQFVDMFAAFDLRSIDNMKCAPRLTPNTTPRMEVIGNIHEIPNDWRNKKWQSGSSM